MPVSLSVVYGGGNKIKIMQTKCNLKHLCMYSRRTHNPCLAESEKLQRSRHITSTTRTTHSHRPILSPAKVGLTERRFGGCVICNWCRCDVNKSLGELFSARNPILHPFRMKPEHQQQHIVQGHGQPLYSTSSFKSFQAGGGIVGRLFYVHVEDFFSQSRISTHTLVESAQHLQNQVRVKFLSWKSGGFVCLYRPRVRIRIEIVTTCLPKHNQNSRRNIFSLIRRRGGRNAIQFL